MKEGACNMINVNRIMMLYLQLIAMSIFFIIAGCAVEIQQVIPQKVDQYNLKAQKAGVKISVDPYIEESRLQTHFGCDLLSRGILPVFVIIENVDSPDGYFLFQEKAQLSIKAVIENKEALVNNQLKNSNKDLQDASKRAEIISSLTLPISVLSPIGLFIAIGVQTATVQQVHNEIKIKQNIENCILVDKTVYSGGSHKGFLFFPLKSRDNVSNLKGLTLYIKNIRSGELVPFLFEFNQ